MKKIIILALAFIITTVVYAHPASKVEATYDLKTQLLRVNFNHSVKNAQDHFISEVVVKVNKRDVIKHSPALQDNGDGGSFIYKLNGIKKGDKIVVQTTCNKSGKASDTVSVE